MSIIRHMDHCTVLTPNVEATREFYGMFGLVPGPRPNLSFPGMWLYAGDRPILHVVTGRPMPKEPGGNLDHMAFRARDLSGTVELLKSRGINFDLRRVPAPYEGWQLFCFDPFGAKVELDFDADEPAPPPS
jgi:catechol 2,3-dioxygenase-like lactoylglutathione lyase family enzyme